LTAVTACAPADAGNAGAPADKGAATSPAIRAPEAASREVVKIPVRGASYEKARALLELGIRSLRGPRKVGKMVEKADVGFLAKSLLTGETVHGSSQEELLSAASNTKLFTTAAALLRLGPDHRFETRFAADVTPRDGILDGDLWIVGGGDPTLTQEHQWCPSGVEAVLARVAEELVKFGVKTVRGSLVLDDRMFAGDRYHPGWPPRDRGKAHALDVSALCVEHDRIQIVADATGSEVAIHTVPRFRGIRLEHAVKVVKGGNAGIVAHAEADSIRVSGSVAAGSSELTSLYWLDGPALYGYVALDAFATRGLEVTGGLRTPRAGESAPARTLVLLKSAVPLTEVVRVTNQESDNLYAEMLLKALGARFRGQGTFAKGLDVVRETLTSLGIPIDGFAAVDGSGLARDSRISASAIVALLEAMARGPVKETFRDSLALGGGREGTLRKRFRDPVFAGRVRAKTGSLDGVSSLSGYADAGSGETFVFSILVNFERGGSSKADEEQLVRRLVEIGPR
jgi:D-alanyl-D-alanine carboxypeptidase/D-alanyl-D-alanine-endopeptidase (penicillin-binding protein 4)